MGTAFAYSPDSPVGALCARTSAALAEGQVPFGCPHPAAADRFPLHLQVLVCGECEAVLVADAGPGECSACGAPDGCLWYSWPDASARVTVVARACPRCMKDGCISLAMN